MKNSLKCYHAKENKWHETHVHESWSNFINTGGTYFINTYFINTYRILPIKGASPNKGTPCSLGKAKSIINFKNTHSFFNNCPIFNLKPPLESSEPQLSPHNIRCDLANAPGALIRQNTVLARKEDRNAIICILNQSWDWTFTDPILCDQ